MTGLHLVDVSRVLLSLVAERWPQGGGRLQRFMNRVELHFCH